MKTEDTSLGHRNLKEDQGSANGHSSAKDWETFAYGLSHDLRAPLRAIAGFSKAILEDHSAGMDDVGTNYLNRIHAASLQMDRLIEGVLIFGQSTQEGTELALVNPLPLITQVTSMYPNLHEALITVSCGPVIPPVLANESALIQCFSNILGNAAKFGTRGVKPLVDVSCKLNAGVVRISFKDNGIGIAAKDHARIFKMFERVDRLHEGTGIGLCLVKRSIERMGGKVGIESEVGKGTTIWIELSAGL